MIDECWTCGKPIQETNYYLEIVLIDEQSSQLDANIGALHRCHVECGIDLPGVNGDNMQALLAPES